MVFSFLSFFAIISITVSLIKFSKSFLMNFQNSLMNLQKSSFITFINNLYNFFIKSLIDKYQGDIESALAAYNGGAVSGDRYVITRSLADIPEETAGYLQKVTSTQKMYDYLYSNIFSAKDIKELITIKTEEEEKPWYKKLLERFGWNF